MNYNNINQLEIDFGYEKPLLYPLPIKKIHNAKRNNFSRLQEQGISTAKHFISNLAEEYFQIEMLQGKKRKAKLQEFKKEPMENLLNTSLYKSILPPSYFKEFKEEIIRINSFQ